MNARALEIGKLLAIGIESELVSPTYRIADNRQSITCLLCGFISQNLNDVSEKKCPRCGTKHDETFADALAKLPHDDGGEQLLAREREYIAAEMDYFATGTAHAHAKALDAFDKFDK